MVNDSYNRAPHTKSTDGWGKSSPNAALFIDFDNVTMGVRSNLGQELRNLLNSDIIRGKVAIQRAYADWRRYPQYVVPLSEASIDLIYAPAYGSSKKNATDIRLAIDALEVVFTRPEIGTYILLSGDSDFSSLVLKLKEYGKYVIGVGMQESSSELLVQNCDEYYSYNALSGLVSAEEVSTERHDPWELAEKAIERMESRNDVMRSDRLKQVMLELDSSFDEKDLGYTKFNRFLTEASSKGILQLRRIGNGQYEVASAGGSTADSSTGSTESEPSSAPSGNGRSGRRKRSSGGDGGGGGRPRPKPPEPIAGADSLKEAYDLLRDVVKELAEGDDSVRDSEVKRRMLERDGDFDEATLGFSKFSRFLRQAHDEGVVTLDKGDEGNYFLRSVGTGQEAGSGAAPASSGSSRPSRSSQSSRSSRTSGSSTEAGTGAGDGEDAAREAEPETAETAEEDGGSDESPGRRPSPLSRRGRRGGSRSRDDGSDASDEKVVPGPAAPAEQQEPAEEAPEAPSPERSGSARRGLGRFRRGSRKGSRAEDGGSGPEIPMLGNVAGSSSASSASSSAGAVAGSDEGADRATGAPSEEASDGPSSAPSPSTDELVEHMSRNYPGVGERTARALVQEFGDRTLDVIDREPGRVKELLPSHRAEAVLDARSEERDAAAG
jgi:uncharacterized LabA/DUF88 family protein